MSREQRHYDQEYKVQAVKLARELGSVAKAAGKLVMSGISYTGGYRLSAKAGLTSGPEPMSPRLQ